MISNPIRAEKAVQCFAKHGLLAFCLVLALTGCSTTKFIRVDPTQPIQLEPSEALLAFHIDSDLPLDRLVLSNLVIRESVIAGRHFWIVRMDAGVYSWRKVVVDKGRFKGQYRIKRSAYERASELDFTIVPGKLNYVGELVIRKSSGGPWSGIFIRIRNHAAEAIRQIEANHPDLFDQYPVHTASTSGDRFLEFYVDERKRLAEESP